MEIYDIIDRYKEAIDKCNPFEDEMKQQLKDYFRINFTWTSNAIEGNSFSIAETKVILEDGLTVGGRPVRELYEVVGHGKAFDYMYSMINERQISMKMIRTLHFMFYNAIDEENAGERRRQEVFAAGVQYDTFPKPDNINKELRRFEDWMKTERSNYHPVEFAALLHLKFASIHPFVDGNGRVSRLLMNMSLLQDKYMPAIVQPIYRTDYFKAIRDYQLNGNAEPFCQFIGERLLETENEIIRLLGIFV